MVGARTGGSPEKPLEQLSDEEFWNYARELAHKAPSVVNAEEYLECSLQQGCCFISLTALYEVVPPPYRFALLPAMPTWMPGLVAWRGEAIAVVDLSAYLFGERRTLTRVPEVHEGSLLIADHADLPIGLYVPSVGSITTINYTPLSDLPDTPRPLSRDLLKGMRDDAYILNMPTLLTEIIKQIEMAAPHG